jgi:hypothetical protein
LVYLEVMTNLFHVNDGIGTNVIDADIWFTYAEVVGKCSCTKESSLFELQSCFCWRCVLLQNRLYQKKVRAKNIRDVIIQSDKNVEKTSCVICRYFCLPVLNADVSKNRLTSFSTLHFSVIDHMCKVF